MALPRTLHRPSTLIGPLPMDEKRVFPLSNLVSAWQSTLVCFLLISWCGQGIWSGNVLADDPLPKKRPQPAAKSGPSTANKNGKQTRPAVNRPRPIALPASTLKNEVPPFEVASVDRRKRSEVLATSAELDAIVMDHLVEKKTAPNRRTSDEVFVRRIYLDLAGRIPTASEVQRFLNSKDENKRDTLIEDLLESPDYVSNLYNFWADVLRLTERPAPNVIADPYLAYVKDSIRTNKPYDKWVYEMLTADGKCWENPAAGFQLRDDAMPLPYVDNTVRVFLGTQIGCAQCHDHPFDNWTQLQFYQLAAFTAGTKTRYQRPKGMKGNPLQQLVTKARQELPQPQFAAAQRLLRANGYEVSETRAPLKLPHDYAYKNGKPNQVVQPEVLWGEIPSAARDASNREQFAAWLTAPENPQFSATIANRLWHRFTGVGIVEPIDDFREENAPWSEALLERLAQEVVRSEFDLKHLIRCIVSTNAYQREAMVYDPGKREEYAFQGPALRRMEAEQVWDSFLTLTVYNSWPFQRPEADAMTTLVNLELQDASLESILQKANAYQQSPYGNNGRKLLSREHGYKGMLLCKASEQPTPLPPSHFLRQFGQGDRDSINGSNTDATVPQILTMFNGPLSHAMLERGSRLGDLVSEAPTPHEAVDKVFLSILARYPDPEERKLAVTEVIRANNAAASMGNVVWALVNTREFLFVR